MSHNIEPAEIRSQLQSLGARIAALRGFL